MRLRLWVRGVTYSDLATRGSILVPSIRGLCSSSPSLTHLNELILEAKCHAIRDAQIAEKHQLGGQMVEENNRLDAMMEIDRVAGIVWGGSFVLKCFFQLDKLEIISNNNVA